MTTATTVTSNVQPPVIPAAPLLEHVGTLITDTVSVQLQLVEDQGKAGKVIVRGEFGRADRATENKRLYPKKLLEREFRRLELALERRQVFGELDHPCLTSDDFRVLTLEGWKPFREIKVGDKVWSRKNGKAMVSKVEAIIDQPYEGEVYRVKGRNIDSTFTPAHKLLLLKRPDVNDGTETYATLQEIVDNRGKYSHYAIPKSASWVEDSPSEFTVPAYEVSGRFKNDVTLPLKLNAELFSAFMGLFLSEGYCSSDKTENYGIFISQKTEWSRQLIKEEVLNKFPKELTWREEKDGFFLSDARLYWYLKPLGDAYNRYIPEEVKKLSLKCLKELLYWYNIGDGRMVDVHPSKDHPRYAGWRDAQDSFKAACSADVRESEVACVRRDVFTVSPHLAADLHECLIRSGGCGSVVAIETKEDYMYAGHLIEAKDKVPLYQLHLATTDHIWMDPRFLKIEKQNHKGNIYCLNTTHGSFYMEQNGKSFWTCNSDGRTSLNRTSHIITGLRLNEDGTVHGEAEALDTERGRNLQALLRANCKVGVSSRGYGSTKPNELGEEVVQDDYKLVTYDFVAEPADTKALPDVFYEENQNMGDTAKDVEAKLDEARAQERAKCKDEFSKELISAIGKLKTEVYEQVKVEMLADPSVAAAKGALDQIKDLVRPYVIPEDANELVKAKDAEISKLRNTIAERDLKVAELEGEIDKLAETAREVGYKYFLEQQIANDPEAEVIRKFVGDVKAYKKAEDIKVKIEAIRAEMTKKREEAEAVEARIREEVERASQAAERAAQRAAMEAEEQRKKAAMLEEALEKAVRSEKELALRLYAEKKLAHHPQASKLRSVMESAHPQTKTEIDGIITSIREPAPAPEDLERVRARVRKLTKGGIGPSAQDEEAPAPSSKKSVNEDYNGLGISLGDLKRLVQ